MPYSGCLKSESKKKSDPLVSPASNKPQPVTSAAVPKPAPRPVIPSISIKEAMTGHPEPKPIEKPEPVQIEARTDEPVPTSAIAGNKPVTPESLAAAWNSFADAIKTEDTRLYSILTAYTPVLEGETKVVFKIMNSLQNEPLQKIQSRLLQHLKTALDHEMTEIEIVLAEKNETAKAYTAEDKFAQMSRKNPSLLTFRQQFMLDFV